MATDVPNTAPLSINGRPFVHDITQYRRRTLQSTRSAIDQSATGGEQSLSTEGYWRRSQRRWIYGTGQVVFDSADLGADATIQRQRYYNGWNCEPDTDTLEGVRMIRRAATSISLTLAELGRPGNSVAYGDVSFAITNAAAPLQRITTAGTATCTGFGTDTPVAVATDGNTVFAAAQVDATHVKMYSSSGGTAFSAMSAGSQVVPTGQFMWRLFFGNGVLLLTINSTIYSVSSTGALSAAIDTVAPIASSYTGITCISCSTNTWFFTVAVTGATDVPLPIYKLTIDSTGAFGKASVALPVLGPTEIFNVAKVVGSVMLIGTTKGFRVGTLDTAGDVTAGPLIPVVTSDTTGAVGGGVTEFARFGQTVLASYYSQSEPFSDGVASTFKAGGFHNGLIMIDLGRFVDILQPAWWYWWRSTTENLSGWVIENRTNPVFVEHNHFFVLGTANLVTPCSFITSWVTVGMDYPKTYIDLEVFHDALASGDSIAVYSQPEDAGTTWTLIGTSSTAGSTTTTIPIPILVSARRMRFGFVMTANSAAQATTPRLRRWQLRVFPDPILTDEILAAIIITENVKVGESDSAGFHQESLEAYQFLQNLVSNGSVVPCVEGSVTTSVKIDRLEMQPTQYAMNTDGSYKGYQGTVIVRMLTLS